MLAITATTNADRIIKYTRSPNNEITVKFIIFLLEDEEVPLFLSTVLQAPVYLNECSYIMHDVSSLVNSN